MEQAKNKPIENNKEQPEKTNKYFYIELLISLFITSIVIFGTYYIYVLSDPMTSFCRGRLNDCIAPPYSIFFQSALIANVMWITISRMLFITNFTLSVNRRVISIILPFIFFILLFMIVIRLLPMDKSLILRIIFILLPVLYTIISDMFLIKRTAIFHKLQINILKSRYIFIVNIISLAIWTISLVVLYDFISVNNINIYRYLYK